MTTAPFRVVILKMKLLLLKLRKGNAQKANPTMSNVRTAVKKGHTKAECWAKCSDNKGGAPWHRNKKAGDKDKKTGNKTSTTKVEEQTPDIETWAAIDKIKEDDTTPCIAVMVGEKPIEGQTELYDMGALCHMSPLCKQFINYQEINAHCVITANQGIFHVVGMGDLKIDIYNSVKLTCILLKDTLYAPDLATTIVLIGHILKAGYKLSFDKDSFIIKKKDESSVIGCVPITTNALFKTEHVLVADSLVLEEAMNILMLHCRLGHILINMIQTLVHASTITSVCIIDNKLSFVCDSCEYGKTTRKPIHKE